MKQLLFGLMLIAPPAVWADDPGAATPPSPVTLYTDFRQAVPAAVADALRAEVYSIMSPAGLRFDWHSLADFRSERVSVAVVVVHFDGRCDASGMVMRPNRPGSLGWTEIADGAILPFIHVDCERVRTFLQTALLGFRPEDRDRSYGRALGRVLAHELYHVFGVTTSHGARGVAKEDYSVEDLLAADFQFHEKQTRALRASRTLAALKASAAN